MGSALRCALAFCNWRGIVLLWRGQGGEWSKGFFVLRKSFFQTEIHLLFSQLISCIPNTNWTTVSSIGLDDAQPVPGEVYLHMIVNIIILFITQDSVTYGQCPEKCICKWKGGKETVQCVNATLTKWDNFSLWYRQAVDPVQCINTTLTWPVWNYWRILLDM